MSHPWGCAGLLTRLCSHRDRRLLPGWTDRAERLFLSHERESRRLTASQQECHHRAEAKPCRPLETAHGCYPEASFLPVKRFRHANETSLPPPMRHKSWAPITGMLLTRPSVMTSLPFGAMPLQGRSGGRSVMRRGKN